MLAGKETNTKHNGIKLNNTRKAMEMGTKAKA